MSEFKPVFGDPDFVYTSAELIVAVNAFPKRFSPDTHELVNSLIAQVITIPDVDSAQ